MYMDRELTIQFAIDWAASVAWAFKIKFETQTYKIWKRKKPKQNKTNRNSTPGKVDIITFTWQTAICSDEVFDSLYFVWSPRGAML